MLSAVSAVAVATTSSAARPRVSVSTRRTKGTPKSSRPVVFGGGGSRNPTLLAMLRERLPGTPVVTHEERGIDSRAKEAMAIAIIASDALRGLPTNVHGATGGQPAVLGKLSL